GRAGTRALDRSWSPFPWHKAGERPWWLAHQGSRDPSPAMEDECAVQGHPPTDEAPFTPISERPRKNGHRGQELFLRSGWGGYNRLSLEDRCDDGRSSSSASRPRNCDHGRLDRPDHADGPMARTHAGR